MRLGNAAIGQYLPGSSLLHRADPRLKIAALTIFAVALFFVGGIAGLLVMGAGLLLALALARVPSRLIFRSIRPVLLLALITFCFQLFLHGGAQLGHLGPLTLYRGGARNGGFLALRLVLLVLSGITLSLTTPPVMLTDALGRLMAPLSRVRFPAYELALMMTIALRFIPALLAEADRIILAQAARGAGLGGGLTGRVRALLPVLIPLFILSFSNADELAQAMESRCYRGGRGRTQRRRLALGRVDALFALLALLLVGAGIVIGRKSGF